MARKGGPCVGQSEVALPFARPRDVSREGHFRANCQFFSAFPAGGLDTFFGPQAERFPMFLPAQFLRLTAGRPRQQLVRRAARKLNTDEHLRNQRGPASGIAPRRAVRVDTRRHVKRKIRIRPVSPCAENVLVGGRVSPIAARTATTQMPTRGIALRIASTHSRTDRTGRRAGVSEIPASTIEMRLTGTPPRVATTAIRAAPTDRRITTTVTASPELTAEPRKLQRVLHEVQRVSTQLQRVST